MRQSTQDTTGKRLLSPGSGVETQLEPARAFAMKSVPVFDQLLQRVDENRAFFLVWELFRLADGRLVQVLRSCALYNPTTVH